MSDNEDSRLGCRWTMEEDIQMCKLRKKGYNFKEIGKLLNRSEKSCATRYSNRGYTLNPLKLFLNITVVIISLLGGVIAEPSLFQLN
ncbi:SANT/Myb-like DNA-binding domain-containing protein [uncultured Methanobacterium sp.]|uniref:SANT/Myb-like DNA-binding domain-containing protein n=1 Tax=uncultured Methanobacterium sp. TaxID=176306 RepID=UPI002AA87DEF|nr:SANT/Myb-like DNA-binding domain-containing protein [uncultured Methanobacterium sp.]